MAKNTISNSRPGVVSIPGTIIQRSRKAYFVEETTYNNTATALRGYGPSDFCSHTIWGRNDTNARWEACDRFDTRNGTSVG